MSKKHRKQLQSMFGTPDRSPKSGFASARTSAVAAWSENDVSADWGPSDPSGYEEGQMATDEIVPEQQKQQQPQRTTFHHDAVNNAMGCVQEAKYRCLLGEKAPIPQVFIMELEHTPALMSLADVTIQAKNSLKNFRMIERSKEPRPLKAPPIPTFPIGCPEPEYLWSQVGLTRKGQFDRKEESEPLAGRCPVERDTSLIFGMKNSKDYSDDWGGVDRTRMYTDANYWDEKIKSVKSHSMSIQGTWRRGQHDIIYIEKPIELSQFWSITVFVRIPPMYDNKQIRPICSTDASNVHLMLDRRGFAGSMSHGSQKWGTKQMWEPSLCFRKQELKDDDGNSIKDPRAFSEPSWVHLAVVSDGVDEEFFMNGYSLGTGRAVNTPIRSIGNMDDQQSSKPCGPIYDFTVWSCALKESEIRILSKSYLEQLNGG